jgi:hypothetical protein
LPGENANNPQAQRLRVRRFESSWRPNPVIFDGQLYLAGLAFPERDTDYASPLVGESMLERIGYQFIQDQSAWDSAMNSQLDGLDVHLNRDSLRVTHES